MNKTIYDQALNHLAKVGTNNLMMGEISESTIQDNGAFFIVHYIVGNRFQDATDEEIIKFIWMWAPKLDNFKSLKLVPELKRLRDEHRTRDTTET